LTVDVICSGSQKNKLNGRPLLACEWPFAPIMGGIIWLRKGEQTGGKKALIIRRAFRQSGSKGGGPYPSKRKAIPFSKKDFFLNRQNFDTRDRRGALCVLGSIRSRRPSRCVRRLRSSGRTARVSQRNTGDWAGGDRAEKRKLRKDGWCGHFVGGPEEIVLLVSGFIEKGIFIRR